MGVSYSKAIVVLSLTVASTGVDGARQWGRPTVSFLSKPPFVSEIPRGGDADTTAATTTTDSEPSLDEKVKAAMEKLGMSPPAALDEDNDCKDGVCPMPEPPSTTASSSSSSTTATPTAPTTAAPDSEDASEMAGRIAKEMNVDENLAMAAIGATSTFGDENQRLLNESAARAMIQSELDLIASIPKDDSNVQALVQEGFDPFLSRRALAFAEQNMEDARAILFADQADAEEEKAAQENEEAAIRAQLREERAAQRATPAPEMVEVKTDFDPTKLPTSPKATPTASSAPNGMPKPAVKESVVFDATTAQIQELVLESPVPVLLDVYADWCGPCKVLGPALEEMAVKSGGVFRLVKVNSDNNRPMSSALEVTALPTVFGVRDGKIVHMFQGMPQSEDMMKNFMMGLFGAAPFSPPVTDAESLKYKELTNKLIKTAGAASFSFSARERLTDRVNTKLDELVHDESVNDVEATATMIRTFLNNVVNNPYETMYRRINLENKRIASVIGNNTSSLAVLKSVGFTKDGNGMTLAKGKKVINIAPLVVARDTIDKWIHANRKEMAAAARKKKDELLRAELQLELESTKDGHEEADQEPEEEVDPAICSLKLRLDGKKKVHEVSLHEDDPLNAILDALKIDAGEEEVQLTCVAKKLVVKSSDAAAMSKSLKNHGLMPAAAIVVNVGSDVKTESSSLKDRVAEKKSKKKGTHTMQSVGIYAKDDNNKAELIDGGGGVWYEHDVSDDEEESKDEMVDSAKSVEGKDKEDTESEKADEGVEDDK